MNKELIQKELQFKAVKSSGPGGQSVNNVSSKVILFFDIPLSEGLNNNEKILLYKTLRPRLTNEQHLILSCEETRSQLKNKQLVIDRFFEILKSNLIIPKKRKASKPSKASIKRIKDKKKQRGELKKSRQKPQY